MKLAKELDFSMVDNLFNYDKDTGLLRWKNAFHTKKIGTLAGSINKKGYVTINIKWQQFSAARIAWVLSYGSIPTDKQIDHINRNPSDNRLSNLRLVTGSENCINRRTILGDETPRGWTLNKKTGKYQAQRKGRYLGLFDTPAEAHIAYLEAKP